MQARGIGGKRSVVAVWRGQLARVGTQMGMGTRVRLVRQHAWLLPRFAHYYQQLWALPRRQRRQLRRQWGESLAGLALLLTLNAVPGLAATLTVTTTNPAVNADGQCSLSEAIHNANADAQLSADCPPGSGADTIVLPTNKVLTLPGIDNMTLGATGLPVISSAITIMGNGSTIQRDPANPAMFRLLAIDGNGALTVEQTTLSGGVALGSYPGNRGGAILNYHGQIMLEGCTVTGNTASSGGGLYNNTQGNAVVVLSNSTISGNSAGNYGGGVFSHADGNTLRLENSTISGNSADRAGGGVYSSIFKTSTMSLSNSTISGNSAGNYGGGVFSRTFEASTVSLTNSMVTGNSAGVSGGGMFSVVWNTSTVSLTDSTVSGNSASLGGGVFSETRDASTVSLTNSTVSDNSADLNGGGVFSVVWNTSTVSLTNNTVSDNSADLNGGGVFSETRGSSMVSLTNSTVSGNSAGINGGGMFSVTLDTSTVQVQRSLISGNTAGSAEIGRIGVGGAFLLDGINVLGHSGLNATQALYGVIPGASDLLATSDGTLPTPLAAMLSPILQDNGGPTLTHALVPGSPAIDAVTSGCPPPLTDQRGAPRPFDGDGAGGSACDIGAVEFGAPVPGVDPCATAVVTLGCTVNGVKNQPCQGGSGDDIIMGTSGHDVILGGAGGDTLKGNAGDDVVCGEEGDDLLLGANGADQLLGGSGSDVLKGEAGDDTLIGGSEADTLIGGTGEDHLAGGSENDKLLGNEEQDTLAGESGNDILDGGADSDALAGGDGTDTCQHGEQVTTCE